jgi:hypothetical protein
VEELLSELSNERALMKAMYTYRDVPISPDMVWNVVKNKAAFQRLVDHGVILEQGNYLELEDPYLQFFLDALGANEEISIQAVDDCIRSIKVPIFEYFHESDQYRKVERIRKVRSSLMSIARRSVQNCFILKRKVENTYKNEPVYANKKNALLSLMEQKDGIEKLVRACEKEIDDQELFFSQASVELRQTQFEIISQFTLVLHTLDEVHKQITDYLNQIEYQNLLLKHIRRLKYLKDQGTLEAHTNVKERLNELNPKCWEPRSKAPVKISLNTLLNSDYSLEIIRKIAKSINAPVRKNVCTDIISKEDIKGSREFMNVVKPDKMFAEFRVTGRDLFDFVLAYDHGFEVTEEERILLFCQITIYHINELNIGPMKVYKHYKYPIVTIK